MMSGTTSRKRERFLSTIIVAFSLLLLLTMVPASMAEPVQIASLAPPLTQSLDALFENFGISRPYYSLEVEQHYNPDAGLHINIASQGIASELLPASLQPDGDGGFKAAGADPTAAGSGGWTPLTRPYLPSADPAVTYWAGSGFQVMDDSGRLHALYGREVSTDIGQNPPDPPGTIPPRALQNIYYARFSEGAWNVPENLTNLAGLQDSEIIYFDADDDGYVHFVYTVWTWGRDNSGLYPAGDPTAYQHEQENLWYRYMSPDGTWSAPIQLTPFTGSWGLLGADFRMHNGRLCGGFVIVRNKETLPAEYSAWVCFREGYLDAWDPMYQLDVLDFSDAPGQLQPSFWPSIDVSDVGGEVTLVYGASTVPGALYTAKSDIYAHVRDASGTWSGPQNISNAPNNQEWMPVFTYYRGNADSALIMAFQYIITQDATHPPHDDIYLIYRAGGAWQAPANVTRVAAGQSGIYLDIELDAFENLHFAYAVARYGWTGAAWEMVGGELKYARETGGGLSAPTTILGYLFRRYPNEIALVLDPDGNAHVLFSTLMYDGVIFWDQNVNYSTNAPGGDPNAFSTPLTLRPNTAYSIYDLAANAFPDGDVLVCWFEKGFDGGGSPNYGRMFSRYRDGDAWGTTLLVNSIPGNTDNLHVIQTSWPSYQDVRRSENGEMQAVFETAKYNVPLATYYDFRKYFTETVNGVWTTPEPISSSGVSGERPHIYADGGQRYFTLYSSIDAATGKDVLYATQQRDAAPPASTYYFAEGTTRAGFEEWLCIQNAGETQANVTITYMLETGENITNNLPVPAHSRATVNVNAAVGPEHDVSARVSADKLIVAERPMYFNYAGVWTGGHCETGARGTSRVWYFAEGTTRGGFEEYLTIQNPSDTEANVVITYVLEDGSTMPGGIIVGPRSRATVNVNGAVGPERDVSMVVQCEDTAIVAERPMYFNYHGVWTGGHCVVGSTSLATRWYFAEGTTRSGFETYICLQNPYNVDAVANLRFILGDGSEIVQPMLVPATSRQTLRVNDAIGPEQDVSTVVESNSVLLAERPMYFDYHGAWTGGHVAAGARSPKNSWFFAEGTTRAGFDEWISLQNPGDIDADTTLSFMLDDGTVRDHDVTVPAHTRITVHVPDIIEPGRDVSVAISSGRAIVAERPMYFLYGGTWTGGHVVLGL